MLSIYENMAELKIPDITKKDSGKYEIRVQNPAGEARSSGSVAVKEHEDVFEESKDNPKAPSFVEPLQPQIVSLGEVVIMEALVESYPTASFQWFYDSRPLEVTATSP